MLTLFLCVFSGAKGQTYITNATQLNDMGTSGDYIITADIDDASGYTTKTTFTGTLSAQAKPNGTFPVISGLTQPLFGTINGGTVKNVMLKDVAISQEGLVGAIACTALGSSKIYNCGILPSTITYNSDGSIASFGSSVASTSDHCGSLVGQLEGTARVINCFSYSNVSAPTNNSKIAAGLVGNNSTSSNQNSLNTVVINCMFYGEIPAGHIKRPVYGGEMIRNDIKDDANVGIGINPYDYYREGVSFDNYDDIDKYNRSWPADVEYLTRFEYYRSILNSNRELCTYWVTGHTGLQQTAADTALIAKWVLDESIAPYPILKKWGKYPSIINPDPEKVWNPAANSGQGGWVQRTNAQPYQGKILTEMGYPGHPGMLKVTVNAGTRNNNLAYSEPLYLPITDMDTLHHDYCYAKVQLPYYNQLFGNVNSTNHATRYGNNYTDYVVTGWKITGYGTDGTIPASDYHHFSTEGDTPYNYADRRCIDNDLFGTTGRVFAQGGYYYVPEGVNEITIEAYWGKAVYLRNDGNYIDRVNITNSSGDRKTGSSFNPAGTLPTTGWLSGRTVKTKWYQAVLALDVATENQTTHELDISVYDQAIVLIGNVQLRNENGAVGYNITDNSHSRGWRPYTIMSMDQNMDNEPDYCFELQFRKKYNRDGIQPIRFDFLPVPELGLAVRHDKNFNTIGIFVPQGHFEITETAFMHTTQFEYDGNKDKALSNNGGKLPAPIILNGGHFEQIVVRYGYPENKSSHAYNNTKCFIMGGHFRMLRFTPGAHTNTGTSPIVRLCPVNAIGGEYPEFYLSGIYRPDIIPDDEQGNPICYTNGGRFDMMAGSGYDKINGNVTFKIDHSLIKEFYGGGINAANPVGGDINITIDHSLVGKYCGGPKVGSMEYDDNGVMKYKTVTTNATGTIFGQFYGGGNGGTSYYREQGYDGNDKALPNPNSAPNWVNDSTKWTNSVNNSLGRANFDIWNPLNTRKIYFNNKYHNYYNENKGFHALYEFECFVESNGIGDNPTLRTYIHWAQFGKTTTGNITNTLTDCTVKGNFYGGGNFGNVNGTVTSTLQGNTVIEGSAYGAGYSGAIDAFRIYDKRATVFPKEDRSGVINNGKFVYLTNDDGTDRYYTWCYKNPQTNEVIPNGVVIPDGVAIQNGEITNYKPATFEYPEESNHWYILTNVPLENLGTVRDKATIIMQGNTIVQGNVFGGGNESKAASDTEVQVLGHSKVFGNIYGGGNMGVVGGNTKVIVNTNVPDGSTSNGNGNGNGNGE